VEPTPFYPVRGQIRGGTIMGKGYIIEGPMFDTLNAGGSGSSEEQMRAMHGRVMDL